MSWKPNYQERIRRLWVLLGHFGIIAYDTFDRPDNPTSLGLADTGQAWQSLQGTWGIADNQAYTSVSAPDRRAAIDIGISDKYVVSCVLKTDSSAQMGIIVRASNQSNLLRVILTTVNLYVQKIVGATLTTLATIPITRTSSDLLKVEVDGSTIKAYLNGGLKATVTDSTHMNNTKVGIEIHNSTTARIDNFAVEVL